MRRFVLVSVVLLLSAAAHAHQQQPPQLTWVRYHDNPGDLTTAAKAQLDPLLASGKIARWGILAPVSRLGEKWTHAVFVSARAMGLSRLGTYERRLREMSEDDYVGQLLRVVHWGAPPP